MSTPMDPNIKIGPREDSELVNRESYQCLLGKLLYLNHTRPDITFVVRVLSPYMHDPQILGDDITHLQAANWVLAYLKSIVGRGLLFYRMGDLVVDVYTNANFVGSLLDQNFITGYFTFLSGNLITW